MSMIKVIQPGAQDFSEPVAALIKISSRGLLGVDKQALIKRAGAEFAGELSRIKFAKDEIPVHMIAIGATEDYGPNRNGDGFSRECCQQYHPTFEKFARFYRDHANKNPAKSFGIVKASAYHEPMRRIELVVALNGSKEAAERNGGLLADKEIEKLAADKDIAVSMACCALSMTQGPTIKTSGCPPPTENDPIGTGTTALSYAQVTPNRQPTTGRPRRRRQR